MEDKDEKELALIEGWEQEIASRKSKHLAKMGRGAQGGGVAERLKSEDNAVLLYDRLSPSEILEMFNNEPERWQEMMRAKELAGHRKLFGYKL